MASPWPWTWTWTSSSPSRPSASGLLFLTTWPEHAGEEIRIRVGYDSLLLVRLDLWDSLSRAQKCEMVDRAKGFTDALDCERWRR